jgi:hypothetical protein
MSGETFNGIHKSNYDLEFCIPPEKICLGIRE